MLRILLTTLIFSLPFLLFAQQYGIVGVVMSKSEGQPVNGATLFLAETGSIAETKADGAFELEASVPGPYSLTVVMPGFTTVEKEVT